jgi:hypothetical protein
MGRGRPRGSRALPQTEALPPPFRRLDPRLLLLATPDANAGKWCGRGPSLARRTASNGSAVLGTKATGETLEELRQGRAAIDRYLTAHQLPQGRTLLRLDGQYGTGAVLSEVAGFAFVTRGKEYSALNHPLVQARLHLPPDQFQQRPESQMVRTLYDCPQVPIGPESMLCRLVVATHPAGKKKSPVGITRSGVVYELFFTTLPQRAFTASDVVELYLHRGAFEPLLSDEDQEIDPDRWCSHSAWGQECWQVISQWIWNLRLELGHQFKPLPLRTTEFAPAMADTPEPGVKQAPIQGYGAPTVALPWKAGRFVSARLHAPVRWRAALPSRQDAASHRAAPRSGWQFACARAAPASATVAIASCAPYASGMGTPRPNPVASVCCSIRFRLAPHPCFGAIGAAEHIGGPAFSWCAINESRSGSQHLVPLCLPPPT